MTTLVDIMTAVSKQLTGSIEASRHSFEHHLTEGEAVENAVRKFLRDHLPDSIGIAHGQVIDRHGSMSKQLDVILYDAQRTPILFSDEADENRIIPVEGVIAAIEAKTNLRLSDIPTLAESARILKTLDRSAYYVEESLLQHVTYAYGKEWNAFPPLYFIVAFDGPNLQGLKQALIAVSADVPIHQRIDMSCVLQRGIVANSDSNGSGIDALPSPDSILKVCETKNSLLLFYILMSRYVLQANVPPISIQSYLPSEFIF
jgi:hypothetical protein